MPLNDVRGVENRIMYRQLAALQIPIAWTPQ